MMKKGLYLENGVSLSKSVLKAGDEVELRYSGLLKAAGAGELKAHVGYNESWEEAEYLDMTHTNDAFIVRVTLKKAGTFNCAFVDPAGNWDNNSGADYRFEVKAAASKKEKLEKPEKAEKTAKKNKTSESPEAAAKTRGGRKPKNAAKAEQEAAATFESAAGEKKTKKDSKTAAGIRKKKAE